MNADFSKAGEHRLSLQFVGSGSEYFRIWIVNLLLTIVTLGFYYPYAKARRLRYFHGATELAGHPLSFHADPHKMLRGYLLVVLLFLACAGADYFSPMAGLAAFAILAAVWPALWHSSLRFRLSNTGWRGMRFHFTGSQGDAYRTLAPGLVAAVVVLGAGLLGPGLPADASPDAQALALTPLHWVAILLPLLMVFAAPALLWLMRRYQQDHLALGAEQTRFEVPLRRFYGLALKAIGLMMVFALLVGIAGMVAAVGVGGPAATGEGIEPAKLLLGVVVAGVLLLVFQAVVMPYVVTRLQNLVWNGTRSRHLRFESTLRVRQMVGLSLRNWLLIIVTLGLYFPFAAVATARLRLQAVSVGCGIDPESLFSSAVRGDESAAGDAAGDLAGLDIGL